MLFLQSSAFSGGRVVEGKADIEAGPPVLRRVGFMRWRERYRAGAKKTSWGVAQRGIRGNKEDSGRTV